MQIDGKSRRIDWIDSAKGLGIILVVIGHVERGLTFAKLLPASPIVLFMDRLIYSFHMPLFFFLSGLFLAHSIEKSSFNELLKNKARTIAYPYFVWSTITIAIKSLLGSMTNHPRTAGDILYLFYAPIDQFWFLYTLFVLTLVLGFLLSIGTNTILLIVLTILINPAVVSFPIHWGTFYEISSSAIYVAIGTVVGKYYLGRAGSLNSSVLPLIFMTGCIVLITNAAVPLPGAAQMLVALYGTASAVALSNMIKISSKLSRSFSFFGRHSLEIFVAHTIACAATRIFLQGIGVRLISVQLIAGILSGIFLPLLLRHGFDILGIRCAFTLSPKTSLVEAISSGEA